MDEQDFAGTERYEIRSQLGRGAMGVVYEAWDRKRNLTVALKTLHIDAGSVVQLKREFRGRAGIVHRNLVSLYELVSSEDEAFITMELVDGSPFQHWVRGAEWRTRRIRSSTTLGADSFSYGSEPTSSETFHDKPLDTEEIQRMDARMPQDMSRLRPAFRQLAEGIDALHRARRLHLDLKPANVLVTELGRVVLVDFGLSAQLHVGDAATDSGLVAGTAAYMAPEQSSGMALTAASDWYAMGVMLYEALTGRRPFEGLPRKVLVEKQIYDAQAPSSLIPGVPGDLDQLCVDLLVRDPSLRPNVDEIMAVLGGGSAEHKVRVRRLVGRAEHMEALRKAWRRARSGRFTAAILQGRSGMGKSFLVEHFLQDLDAVVLRGRCYEREVVAYNAFDSLIDELADVLQDWRRDDLRWVTPDLALLAELFPQLRVVHAIAVLPVVEIPDPFERRRRAFRALRSLLQSLGPVVLHLDDVQWADAESARLFAALLRGKAKVLVVLSCRNEGNDFMGAARAALQERRCGIQDIDVGVLTSAEALDHATALLGERGTADLAERIVRESGGSPFFIEELIRYVGRPGASGNLNPHLEDAIRARVGELPEESRRLAEIVAVAGRPITVGVVSKAGAVDDLLINIDRLQAAHVVLTSPGRVQPFHDRVREAVVGSLTEEDRRGHHQSLAEAYEGVAEPDNEALMTHWDGAGLQAKAGPYALAAAEDALGALAFDRGANLLGKALDWLELEPLERCTLLERQGDALAHAGRCAEGGQAYLQAADLGVADPLADLELRRSAAEQYLASGHHQEGLLVADTVLRAVGMRIRSHPRYSVIPLLWNRLRLDLRGTAFKAKPPTPEARLRLRVCRTMMSGLSFVDFIQGEVFMIRHLREALDLGDAHEVARGMCGFSASLSHGSPRDRARIPALLERARELVGDDPELLTTWDLCEAIIAFDHGEFSKIIVSADRGLERIRKELVGMEAERTSLRLYKLWGHIFKGDLRTAGSEAPRAIREATQRGNLRFIATAQTEIYSLVALAKDRPEEAVAAVDEYTRRWSREGLFQLQHQSAMLAHGQINTYRGDADEAYRRMEETWPLLVRSLLLNHRFIRLEGWLLRARCALAYSNAHNCDKASLNLAKSCLNKAGKDAAPWSEAIRTHVAATLARVEGREEDAIAGYRVSLEACVATEQLLHAAAIRRQLGTMVGGDEGRELIDGADTWFRGQGVRNPEAMTNMALGC